MNLRILKKLSKRAAPLLIEIDGDDRAHWVTSDGDGEIEIGGMDRKHMDRIRTYYQEPTSMFTVIVPARRDIGGRSHIALYGPHTPLPGTPMLSWSGGYFDDDGVTLSAWETLERRADDAVIDFVEDGKDDEGFPIHRRVVLRHLRNPSDILRQARAMAITAKAGRVKRSRMPVRELIGAAG